VCRHQNRPYQAALDRSDKAALGKENGAAVHVRSRSAPRYSVSPCAAAGHRSGSCAGHCGRPDTARPPKHRHTAHQVSGYPASAAPPTIAVAALLGLARWCRQCGQQQGASPCAGTGPDQSPPIPEAAQPAPQRPAPLGPTHPQPAARSRSPRRTVARPAPTDGRPSGGQP
jgi:hypothetical protein